VSNDNPNASLGGVYAAAFLLFAIALAGRLCAYIFYNDSSVFHPLGVASDLFTAIGLACGCLLARRIHWLLVLSITLLWWGGTVSSVESILALDKTIAFQDLHYATDSGFLKRSVQHPSYPVGFFVMLLLAILSSFMLRNQSTDKSHVFRAGAGGALSLVASLALATNAMNWREGNAIALIFTSTINLQSYQNDNALLSLPPAKIDEGMSMVSHPAAGRLPNVLLLVLEGIPGAYLKQSQDRYGVEAPITMENLSEIALEGLTLPNFVTHSHQTIRGLYAMLCGDYSSLTLSTPKSIQYDRLPVPRPACLPEMLEKKGFQTAYFQAANLQFMAKNRFMPAVGFENVEGGDSFPNSHVSFEWGPDDLAFLEQLIPKLQALGKNIEPWFATALTVGTHHPFGVTEEWSKSYKNRKLASVAYLDKALGDFYQNMRRTGLLENTLLIITSDESHGLPGHPHGGNWGFAIAIGAGVPPKLHGEAFGLMDIPTSIGDYLGIPEAVGIRAGRSVFRTHKEARELLFSSTQIFLADAKDRFYACKSKTDCSRYLSGGDGLFGSNYTIDRIRGKEAESLYQRLSSAVGSSERSLQTNAVADRYTFLEQARFDLPIDEWTALSGGQFVSARSGQRLTVELSVSNVGAEPAESVSFHRGLRARSRIDGRDFDLGVVDLPLLGPGEAFDLSFSQRVLEDVSHIAFSLAGLNRGDSRATIEVGRLGFTVDDETIGELKINHFEQSKRCLNLGGGATKKGIGCKGKSYANSRRYCSRDGRCVDVLPAAIGLEITASNLLGQYLHSGWSGLESWGVWSTGRRSALRFTLPTDETPTNLVLTADFRAFLKPEHPTQTVAIYLNDQLLAEVKFSLARNREKYFWEVPSTAWNVDGVNTLEFHVSDPKSPQTLGYSSDTRALGIGLLSFSIIKGAELSD
jgi:hypothetical protein